jgi:hypothetical protein
VQGLDTSNNIAVGGKTASIPGFELNVYGHLDPPFPLRAAAYAIPLGSIGPVGVAVASSFGMQRRRPI